MPTDQSTEEWRPLPGSRGVLSVSDAGRVRKNGQSVSPGGHTNGYRQISAANRQWLIHRAVLEAFVGPCPAGLQCRHLDGDKTNNHLSNLSWGTPKQNSADRARHGAQRNQRPGELHSGAILTDAAVLDIRRRDGDPTTTLAAEYGVSPRTIYSVRKRKTWRHI